jgi:hypothetical protein
MTWPTEEYVRASPIDINIIIPYGGRKTTTTLTYADGMTQSTQSVVIPSDWWLNKAPKKLEYEFGESTAITRADNQWEGEVTSDGLINMTRETNIWQALTSSNVPNWSVNNPLYDAERSAKPITDVKNVSNRFNTIAEPSGFNNKYMIIGLEVKRKANAQTEQFLEVDRVRFKTGSIVIKQTDWDLKLLYYNGSIYETVRFLGFYKPETYYDVVFNPPVQVPKDYYFGVGLNNPPNPLPTFLWVEAMSQGAAFSTIKKIPISTLMPIYPCDGDFGVGLKSGDLYETFIYDKPIHVNFNIATTFVNMIEIGQTVGPPLRFKNTGQTFKYKDVKFIRFVNTLGEVDKQYPSYPPPIFQTNVSVDNSYINAPTHQTLPKQITLINVKTTPAIANSVTRLSFDGSTRPLDSDLDVTLAIQTQNSESSQTARLWTNRSFVTPISGTINFSVGKNIPLITCVFLGTEKYLPLLPEIIYDHSIKFSDELTTAQTIDAMFQIKHTNPSQTALLHNSSNLNIDVTVLDTITTSSTYGTFIDVNVVSLPLEENFYIDVVFIDDATVKFSLLWKRNSIFVSIMTQRLLDVMRQYSLTQIPTNMKLYLTPLSGAATWPEEVTSGQHFINGEMTCRRVGFLSRPIYTSYSGTEFLSALKTLREYTRLVGNGTQVIPINVVLKFDNLTNGLPQFHIISEGRPVGSNDYALTNSAIDLPHLGTVNTVTPINKTFEMGAPFLTGGQVNLTVDVTPFELLKWVFNYYSIEIDTASKS